MYLIVNADDYGYSAGVSRGILDAARDGAITATGVMANAPHFNEHVGWLRAVPQLDVGVHLNLTFGEPLSARMRDLLAGWGREAFPTKYRAAWNLMSGRMSVDHVEGEWRAQIDRCLESGLRIRFLNSHEHLHMLPPLFGLMGRLAAALDIPHTRAPSPEWREARTPGALARNAMIHALAWGNRRREALANPELLGLSRSGRLTLSYLERRVADLHAGRVYELMCHPGYLVPGEMDDARVLSYHDWEGELSLLCSEAMRALLRSRGVLLVGYRDLIGAQEQSTGRVREPGS